MMLFARSRDTKNLSRYAGDLQGFDTGHVYCATNSCYNS